MSVDEIHWVMKLSGMFIDANESHFSSFIIQESS